MVLQLAGIMTERLGATIQMEVQRAMMDLSLWELTSFLKFRPRLLASRIVFNLHIYKPIFVAFYRYDF